METKEIKFTLNEANALIQLIDVAVKAQGLSAAEAGLILSKKIQEAFSEKEVKKD